MLSAHILLLKVSKRLFFLAALITDSLLISNSELPEHVGRAVYNGTQTLYCLHCSIVISRQHQTWITLSYRCLINDTRLDTRSASFYGLGEHLWWCLWIHTLINTLYIQWWTWLVSYCNFYNKLTADVCFNVSPCRVWIVRTTKINCGGCPGDG